MIRFFSESDLPILQSFWKQKGLADVPRECIPSFGVISENDGVIHAAAFLAECDAQMGSIGMITGNPNISKLERSDALDGCIQAVISQAKDRSLSYLSCATNIPALKTRYEKFGFFKTDDNVTHFARRIE